MSKSRTKEELESHAYSRQLEIFTNYSNWKNVLNRSSDCEIVSFNWNDGNGIYREVNENNFIDTGKDFEDGAKRQFFGNEGMILAKVPK